MSKNYTVASTGTSTGIGIGCALAMLIFWSYSHSVLWTLFHGIFGWFYVIISLFTGKAHL